MEFIRMDIPKGNSITRVLKTPRYQFPSCITAISVDFFPMFEVAWKGKQAMLDTIRDLNDCKRKANDLSVTTTNTIVVPPAFYRSC